MTKQECQKALDEAIAKIEGEWKVKDASYTFRRFWTKEGGLVDTLFVDVINNGKAIERVKVPDWWNDETPTLWI